MKRTSRTSVRKSASWLFLAFAGLASFAFGDGAGPSFKENEKFTYKLTTAGSSGSQQVKTSQGPAAYVPGIPDRETALVKGGEPCGQARCLVLEIDQEVPPFLPENKDGNYQEQILARVDAASGDVKSFVSKLTIGKSISTSEQTSFDRSSTVGDFFGPWMLDLKDGYKQTFKRGSVERSFEVVGRESVAGRECFVVKRILTLPGGGTSATTFWVDAKRRFTVKVQGSSGRTLALAS